MPGVCNALETGNSSAAIKFITWMATRKSDEHMDLRNDVAFIPDSPPLLEISSKALTIGSNSSVNRT